MFKAFLTARGSLIDLRIHMSRRGLRYREPNSKDSASFCWTPVLQLLPQWKPLLRRNWKPCFLDDSLAFWLILQHLPTSKCNYLIGQKFDSVHSIELLEFRNRPRDIKGEVTLIAITLLVDHRLRWNKDRCSEINSLNYFEEQRPTKVYTLVLIG